MTCDVCLESFSEAGSKSPVVLPCGHSFCQSCCVQFKQKCASCRASFANTSINYALLSCISNKASASKKRPAEEDIFKSYCTEELLVIIQKKNKISDLKVQIDAKTVEYKRLVAVANERKEHFAGTVAAIEQSVRDNAEDVRREHLPNIAAMQAAVDDADKNRREVHIEIRTLTEESQGLDPTVAAARAKANSKSRSSKKDTAARFAQVMSVLDNQEAIQDVQVARTAISSVQSLIRAEQKRSAIKDPDTSTMWDSIMRGVLRVMEQHRTDVLVAEKGLCVMCMLVDEPSSPWEGRESMVKVDVLDSVLMIMKEHIVESERASLFGCTFVDSLMKFGDISLIEDEDLKLMAKLVVQTINLHPGSMNVIVTCNAICAIANNYLSDTTMDTVSFEMASCGLCEKLVEAMRKNILVEDGGATLKQICAAVRYLASNRVFKKLFVLSGAWEVLESVTQKMSTRANFVHNLMHSLLDEEESGI